MTQLRSTKGKIRRSVLTLKDGQITLKDYTLSMSLSTWMCVCTHVQEPAEARSGCWVSSCWSYRAGHDAGDLNCGPLGEPEALLTAESSLQL